MSSSEGRKKNDLSILDLMDRSSARATASSPSIGEVPLGGAETPRRSGDAPDTKSAPAQVPAAPAPAKPVVAEQRIIAAPAAPAKQAPPPKAARRGWGGLAVLILALAVGGLAWYGARALRRNNVSLARLPGMQSLISGLNGRMDDTEARLRGLSDNWGTAQARLAALDRKLAGGLQVAHQQTAQLVNQAQERIEAEMHQRDRAVDSRLAGLESSQQDQGARLAELQNQVGAVRQAVTAGQDESGREMAALGRRVDDNQAALGGLNRRLDRQKVTFEASKGAARELVPGITVTVTKTNVDYQRFGGYLSLVRDGRTLWLSNVGVQQSVAFFPAASSEAYNLVVTSVSSNGVVGYLMVPMAGNEGEGAATPDAAAPGL